MKKFLLVTTLILSSSAFAQMCEVKMIDTRTNRVLHTFSSNDAYDGCKEGMKSCRLEIRRRNSVGRLDCVRPIAHPTPVPRPNPMPYPAPIPPRPEGSHDARRPLYNGESVIMNHSNYTVVGQNFQGQYTLRNMHGALLHNIRRDAVDVKTGCNLGLCVGDRVINNGLSYVTIAGLSYNNKFTVRNMHEILTMNIDRNNVSVTQGCVSVHHYQVCVGDQVLLTNGHNYVTVAGIQSNGYLIVKNFYGMLNPNINPAHLVVTR